LFDIPFENKWFALKPENKQKEIVEHHRFIATQFFISFIKYIFPPFLILQGAA